MTDQATSTAIAAEGAPPAATAETTGIPAVNRRRRGILGGAVLVAVAVPYLMQWANVPDSASYLFLALGLAFLAAYLTGFSPYVYLVPAATLMSFGFGLLIPSWLGLPADTVPQIFFASLTVGLVAVFVVRPARRWPLIPAGAFGIITLLAAFRVAQVVPPQLQPLLVPAILIAVGVYLIVGPRL